MLTMPTAYGAEFRQDVIDVARKGEAPLAQIAKDFGLSVTTLKRWLPSPNVRNPGPARRRRIRPRCGS
jgi:transposase